MSALSSLGFQYMSPAFSSLGFQYISPLSPLGLMYMSPHAVCHKLGLPSPAIRDGGHVGTPLPPIRDRPTQYLDAYGRSLLTHQVLVNKNGVRTKWHDAVLNMTLKSLQEDGIRSQTECFGLFASVIPPAHRGSVALQARFRQRDAQRHVVPDLLFFDPRRGGRSTLCEFKTLAWETNYHIPNALAISGAPGRPMRRPCDRRAEKLEGEYVEHAQKIDQALYTNGYPRPADGVGPGQARLRSFGDLVGCVWSSFGCASSDVHALAAVAGENIARLTWQDAGAQTYQLSRSAQIQRIYRLWALTADRARAQTMLSTLGHLVGGQLVAGAVRSPHDATLSRQQQQSVALAYETSPGGRRSMVPYGARKRPGA